MHRTQKQKTARTASTVKAASASFSKKRENFLKFAKENPEILSEYIDSLQQDPTQDDDSDDDGAKQPIDDKDLIKLGTKSEQSNISTLLGLITSIDNDIVEIEQAIAKRTTWLPKLQRKGPAIYQNAQQEIARLERSLKEKEAVVTDSRKRVRENLDEIRARIEKPAEPGSKAKGKAKETKEDENEDEDEDDDIEFAMYVDAMTFDVANRDDASNDSQSSVPSPFLAKTKPKQVKATKLPALVPSIPPEATMPPPNWDALYARATLVAEGVPEIPKTRTRSKATGVPKRGSRGTSMPISIPSTNVQIPQLAVRRSARKSGKATDVNQAAESESTVNNNQPGGSGASATPAPATPGAMPTEPVHPPVDHLPLPPSSVDSSLSLPNTTLSEDSRPVNSL